MQDIHARLAEDSWRGSVISATSWRIRLVDPALARHSRHLEVGRCRGEVRIEPGRGRRHQLDRHRHPDSSCARPRSAVTLATSAPLVGPRFEPPK